MLQEDLGFKMIHDDNEPSPSAQRLPCTKVQFVFAENYPAAYNHAEKLGLASWKYCSYIEQTFGLKECDVYLAPGWRNRVHAKLWYSHMTHRRFNFIASEGDVNIFEVPQSCLTSKTS